MAPPLGKVGKALYKSLLKSARTFDEGGPALKALICRNVGGDSLPQPLDDVVAAFLGSLHRRYFWPAPLAPQSVVEAVRIAFRFPLDEPGLEGAFQGVRYLSGLLNVADKHHMILPRSSSGLGRAAAAAAGGGGAEAPAAHAPLPGVRLLAAPERGALLIAHPCLPHWFARSALLVCQHSAAGGAYALCLNKPLGDSVRDITQRAQQAAAGPGAGAPTGIALRAAPAGAKAFSTAAGGDAPPPGAPPPPAPLADALTLDAGAAAAAAPPPHLSAPAGGGEGLEEGDDAARHAGVLETLVGSIEMEQALGGLHNVEVIDGDELLRELTAAVEAAHASDDEGDDGGEEGGDGEEGGGEEWGSDGDGDGDGDDEGGVQVAEIRLGGREGARAMQALFQVAAQHGARFSVSRWGRGGEEDDEGEEDEGEGEAEERAPLTLSTGHLLAAGPPPLLPPPNEGALTALAPGATSSRGSSAVSASSPSSSAAARAGGGQPGGAGGGPASPGAGSAVTAKEVMGLFAGSPLFRGGPVPGFQVLHCRPELGGQEVRPPGGGGGGGGGGVFLGLDPEALAKAPALLKEGQLTEEDVKVFVGDSGWSPGQLEEEIAMGSWAVVQVPPAVLDLFGPSFEVAWGGAGEFEAGTWRRLLGAAGAHYIELGAVPPGVWRDLAELRV